MSLDNILKEIETLKPTAELEVNAGPAVTAMGRLGQKRQAQERIKDLTKEYSNALTDSSFFIITTGSERDAFCQEASTPEFLGFTVDSDQLYKDLIATINPTLFGRERTGYLFNAVGDALYDRALQLGVTSYNSLQYKEKYSAYVKNAEELLPVIRQAITEQVGSEFVGIDARARVVQQAIERKHTAPVTPIIINASDEATALELQSNFARLTSRVFLVAAGKASKNVLTVSNGNFIHLKKVNKETVEQVFNNIHSKLFQN